MVKLLILVLLQVALVLCCCDCNSKQVPQLWKEDWKFRESIRTLIQLANMTEIEAMGGNYPNPESEFMLENIERIPKYAGVFVYFYPPKYSKGPFDLFWVGLDDKFEKGGGDDVSIRSVAKRLCDEEGFWQWRTDINTQLFYEKWRELVYEQRKERIIGPP